MPDEGRGGECPLCRVDNEGSASRAHTQLWLSNLDRGHRSERQFVAPEWRPGLRETPRHDRPHHMSCVRTGPARPRRGCRGGVALVSRRDPRSHVQGSPGQSSKLPAPGNQSAGKGTGARPRPSIRPPRPTRGDGFPAIATRHEERYEPADSWQAPEVAPARPTSSRIAWFCSRVCGCHAGSRRSPHHACASSQGRPTVIVAPGARPPSQLSMCSSDRKRFIVLQVKTMSSHHRDAGTRQWNSRVSSSGNVSTTS